jgi:glutaredoxin 3
LGIDAKVIELDDMKDGDEMQRELHKLSGQRTVPNVFINGKHLGGNDDTQVAARSGKLEEMLK